MLLAAGLAIGPVLGGVLPDFSGPLRQFEIVRQALRDELWSIAARHADRAAAEKKLETRARLAKLEALDGAGRYAEMLSELDAWKESGELFRYWRAWTLVRLERRAEAVSVLKDEFADITVQPLVYRLRARLAADAADYRAADAAYRLAAVVVATNAPARARNALEWAQMLELSGDSAAAIAVIKNEKVTEIPGEPGDDASDFLANVFERVGRTNDAVSVRMRLVDAGTNTSERVFVNSACALARFLRETDEVKARELSAKAVARACTPEARRRAGYLDGFLRLSASNTRADGIARVKALVKEFPSAPETRTAELALADALLELGDAENAAVEYRIFLEMYPDVAVSGDVHVYEGLARAQLALGRRTEAIGLFARAAKMATNSVTVARCHYRQGDVLVADGRFVEAAALFAEIAKNGGEYAERARFSHADALERSGDSVASAEVFKTFAKVRGNLADEAMLRFASCRSSNGVFEDAIAAYSRLIDRKDLSPALRERALVGRGRAFYRAYRFKDASADFAAVATLAPARRDEMRFLTALCHYGDRDGKAAKEEVVALLAEARDEQLRNDLVFWLAKYDALHENWVSAETGFEAYARAMDAHPLRAADALVRAARVAGARSDYAKAVELVSKAVKKAPSAPFLAEALLLQGEALMTLARYEDALLVLDRVQTAAPRPVASRRAGILRADVLFAMGAADESRYAEALEAYRVILSSVELTPSERISVAFKTARTLERLRRHEEAVDQYYADVIEAYEKERATGTWFDEAARTCYTRAAFALADHYEDKGGLQQAVNILRHVVRSRLPAAEEAGKRIAKLKMKGGVE